VRFWCSLSPIPTVSRRIIGKGNCCDKMLFPRAVARREARSQAAQSQKWSSVMSHNLVCRVVVYRGAELIRVPCRRVGVRRAHIYADAYNLLAIGSDLHASVQYYPAAMAILSAKSPSVSAYN
jgi:hypothetical protein